MYASYPTKGLFSYPFSITFAELYLPYVATLATEGTNYLEAGTGIPQTTKTDGRAKFYWHPGNVGYATGFYECANTLIPEGCAYLSIPESMVSDNKGFKLVFKGTVTGIAEISLEQGKVYDDGWYTLQGVRLSSKPTQAGMYLYKGRKTIVR